MHNKAFQRPAILLPKRKSNFQLKLYFSGIYFCNRVNEFSQKYEKVDFIVSATLSGETLKYPPFHGIFFFVEIFLVSGISQKNGYHLLILRYWFVYIFDIRTIKITLTLWEFSMITIFTLINSFTCCCFFK